jgi:tetratricopeptide (TPR) repeat protein
MSATAPSRTGLARPLRRVIVVAVVIVIGLAGWLIVAELSAWSALDKARAALDADRPDEASRLLAECLRRQPNSGEVNYLAAQAARRTGDLPAARKHLAAAAKAGWVETALDLERALLNVQEGDLDIAEGYLQECLAHDHPDSRLIAEVLTPAYLNEFRLVEAATVNKKWVELAPDSAKGWKYRATILEKMRIRDEATTAYRRAVELAPDDRDLRMGLVHILLETKQPPEEAAGHLEWLMERAPDDPAVRVELAICREAQGKPDEAIRLLDELIAKDPGYAAALLHRGRIDLDRGRAADGVSFLRRAVEREPVNTYALYTLVRCLQLTGPPEELQAIESRWKRADADLQKLSEVTRGVARFPNDPDRRFQAGELFLRNGFEEQGLRWMNSALRIDPRHRPTHKYLAEYYRKTGQPHRAAEHQLRSGEHSPSLPGRPSDPPTHRPGRT